MNNHIYPCLWFDGKASEAAHFYCSIFSNSKMIADTPMVALFEIEGKKIMGLNGGPMFTINPSISMFVFYNSEEEIDMAWNKLSEGGSAMMPLDKYPWAEKYGWVKDKFGMTWQLMKLQNPVPQKITTSLLFVGQQYGKGREAMEYYSSVFPDSKINEMKLYEEGEGQKVGTLKYGNFTLNGENFAAMDGMGEHQFQFSEGVSLVVECKNQQEIDHYWNTMTKDGAESMCGWLKDKFGVSWQIIPENMGSLMKEPGKAGRVMEKVMKMKKLDMEVMENA